MHVSLVKFEEELKNFPVYVLPIEHSFLFNEAEAFNKLVIAIYRILLKNKIKVGFRRRTGFLKY